MEPLIPKGLSVLLSIVGIIVVVVVGVTISGIWLIAC